MESRLATALGTDGLRARAVLTAREREACARLAGPHRQMDFRAGRLAIKRAAVRAIGGAQGRHTGRHLEVISAVDAPPRLVLVDSKGGRTPAAHPISISHRDGRAVAAVAPPGLRVGVDLERARSVDPTTSRYFLTEEERALAPGGDPTVFWCLKEAAWKALSLDRSVPFKHLELVGRRAGPIHAVQVCGVTIPVGARLTTPWRGYIAAIVWIAGGEA